MPFMKGAMPIRRTLYFLNKGEIIFRPSIKVFVTGMNKSKGHEGMQEFVFWEFAQIQWKNPEVQVTKLFNRSPYPFIMAFTESGSEIVLDCDHLDRQEIHDLVKRYLCKTSEMSKLENVKKRQIQFGDDHQRQCICEIEGQRPCTSVLKNPLFLSGTWRWNKNCPE